MISQLQASDLPHLLAFKQRWQNAGSSSDAHPPDLLRHTLARYEKLHRTGQCVHVVYRHRGEILALAGVLFTDDTPFLSTKTKRYAQIFDEYVSPGCPEPGINELLRAALLAIIAENNAVLTTEPPANRARIDAFASGNPRI